MTDRPTGVVHRIVESQTTPHRHYWYYFCAEHGRVVSRISVPPRVCHAIDLGPVFQSNLYVEQRRWLAHFGKYRWVVGRTSLSVLLHAKMLRLSIVVGAHYSKNNPKPTITRNAACQMYTYAAASYRTSTLQVQRINSFPINNDALSFYLGFRLFATDRSSTNTVYTLSPVNITASLPERRPNYFARNVFVHEYNTIKRLFCTSKLRRIVFAHRSCISLVVLRAVRFPCTHTGADY